MADEGKMNLQRERGARAKAERGGQLIDEFFTQAKDACHQVWAQTDPNEVDVRETAWMRLQALGDIEMCYTKLIRDGEFALRELFGSTEEPK